MDRAASHSRNLDLDITYEPGATLREGNQIDADFGGESIVASVAVPELNKRIPYPFTLSLYFEDKWALLDVQLSSGVMKVSFPQRRLFGSLGVYLLALGDGRGAAAVADRDPVYAQPSPSHP